MIEHVDKIVGLRRNLVLEESRFPAELTGAFTNMERYRQHRGASRKSARLDWTQGPAVRGADRGRGGRAGGPDAVAELECLYWVGCAASFDDRNRRVARAVVTCLEAAGVVTRSSARRSRARATRRGGWATTTCSRCWPAATSRR